MRAVCFAFRLLDSVCVCLRAVVPLTLQELHAVVSLLPEAGRGKPHWLVRPHLRTRQGKGSESMFCANNWGRSRTARTTLKRLVLQLYCAVSCAVHLPTNSSSKQGVEPHRCRFPPLRALPPFAHSLGACHSCSLSLAPPCYGRLSCPFGLGAEGRDVCARLRCRTLSAVTHNML